MYKLLNFAIILSTLSGLFWFVNVPETKGQLLAAPATSCLAPSAEDASACEAIESSLLNSTVRLFMYTTYMHDEEEGWGVYSSNGHATVVGGQYLITHNHHDKTIFRLLTEGDPNNQLIINIFDSQGKLLLAVPANTVGLTVVGNETVMLDFGTRADVGLFTSLGLTSAEYLVPETNGPQPGQEVAQVDWDGKTAHVNWVTIETVTTQSDTAIFKLSGCILLGASGGGLFWQGKLIGNNWSTSRACGQELGPGISHHSKVAINLPAAGLPQS